MAGNRVAQQTDLHSVLGWYGRASCHAFMAGPSMCVLTSNSSRKYSVDEQPFTHSEELSGPSHYLTIVPGKWVPGTSLIRVPGTSMYRTHVQHQCSRQAGRIARAFGSQPFPACNMNNGTTSPIAFRARVRTYHTLYHSALRRGGYVILIPLARVLRTRYTTDGATGMTRVCYCLLCS